MLEESSCDLQFISHRELLTILFLKLILERERCTYLALYCSAAALMSRGGILKSYPIHFIDQPFYFANSKSKT